MTGSAGAVSAGGGAGGPLDGWLPPDPAVPGAPRLGVPAARLPPHLQVLLAAPLPVRGGHHGEQPPLQRTQHPLLPLQIGAGQHRTSINFGCWFVFYIWRPYSYHYIDNSYNDRLNGSDKIFNVSLIQRCHCLLLLSGSCSTQLYINLKASLMYGLYGLH